MSKITQIKVKQEQDFSEAYDIGAKAANVTLSEGKDLETKFKEIQTPIEKSVLAIAWYDLSQIPKDKSLLEFLAEYFNITTDEVATALYGGSPSKYSFVVIGLTGTPAFMYLSDEYGWDEDASSSVYKGTYFHLTGFNAPNGNNIEGLAYVDSNIQIDTSNYYIDTNELLMHGVGATIATPNNLLTKADSYEDATAKSIMEPEKFFYWTDQSGE